MPVAHTSQELRNYSLVVPEGVLTALEQICLVVDGLWQSAEEYGSEVGVSLGEASMALHKALVVLIEKGSESQLPVISPVEVDGFHQVGGRAGRP
jgi:hypothetical protein